MKYSEFLKALQSGTVAPVITFLGEEQFLKDRAMDALTKRFLSDDARQFNYRSLTGDEIKDVSFLEDASTLPMFSDWKVMYIKQAAALDKGIGRIKDYLERYLEQPSPSTLLVFDLDKWEGRAKLKGLLASRTAVVEFNPLSEKELPSWISNHLRTLNFQIDSSATQALVERTGTDLQRIASALEKLMLLKHSERRIVLEDIEKMVGHSPTAKIWDWTDAIMNQDGGKAIRTLNDLIELGEEPVKCVFTIAKQYEKMILAKEMVLQRVPEETIAKKIGKPAYYLRPYLNQLAQFSMHDLVKGISILSAADKALKTSQSTEESVLQLMTIQLCSLKEPAKPIFDVPLQ